ncbi:MAG: hypothetical protein ACYDAE_04830 [Steroidobacteraceae bacterium]
MAVRKTHRTALRHRRIVHGRRRADSGSLPKGKDSVRSAKKSHGYTKSLPDLHAILGRFSDALSMVVVAYRALDERASDVEAATVLAQGIAALNTVYTEIDMASIQLYTSSVVKRRSS